MSRALRLFDNWRKEVGFTPGAENEEEMEEIRERMIGELKDVLTKLCKEEGIAQCERNQEDSQETSPRSPPPTPRTPSPSPSPATTMKSSLKRKRDDAPPEPIKLASSPEPSPPLSPRKGPSLASLRDSLHPARDDVDGLSDTDLSARSRSVSPMKSPVKLEADTEDFS